MTGLLHRISNNQHQPIPRQEPFPTKDPKAKDKPSAEPRESLYARFKNGAKKWIPHPMISAGDGLAKGMMDEAQSRLTSKEFEKQSKAFINSLLLATVSQDILNLKTLLKKAQASPDTMSNQEITEMQRLLDHLSVSETLTGEERGRLQTLRPLINPDPEIAEFVNTAMVVRRNLQQQAQGNLRSCIEGLTGVIKREQGALLTAVKFLESVLLHPQKGMLKAANIQLTTAEDSILRNALNVLREALFREDGILPTALTQMQGTLVGEGGILPTALDQTRETADRLVAGTLAQARETLVGADGVVPTALAHAKETVVGEDGILPEALQIVSNHLQRKPHPLLLELQKKIKECKQALAQGKDTNPSAESALKLIRAIIARLGTVLPQVAQEDPDYIKVLGIETLLKSNVECNPFEEPRYPLTLENLAKVEEFLQELCTEQQNVLEQAADILLQKMNPVWDHVDNLPSIWINNAKKALGILDEPSADGTAQAGAMSGFLGSIGGAFKQMLSNGMTALSKEAVGSFVTLIFSFIQKVEAQIDPKFGDQKAALQALIEEIDHQKNTDGLTIQDLKGFFDRLVKICDTMNICVNGLYLPHFTDDFEEGSDSESVMDAYDHVEMLNSAHDDGDTSSVQEDWESAAIDEKNTLASNLVSFHVLEFINEKIRHKQPDHAAYIIRMKDAKQLNVSLESMVYSEIKTDASTPWYSAWWQIVCTWFVFRIAHSMIEGFVKRLTDSYLKETFDYIREQKQHHFEVFTRQRISDANNYLSVLNAAFDSLPKIETAYGSRATMIKREMENPLRNHFYTVGEINEELAQNVIEKGIGNRTLAWIIGKMLPKKQHWVEHAMSKMMAATRDSSGYADAVNTVIIELLENVEKSMKTSARNKAAKPMQAPMSSERKRELGDLMRNLFQILDKTAGKKAGSGLLDVLKNKLEGALGINIDNMIIDEMMDSSTFVVADAIEMLAQEDQLQMLAYKFIRQLNKAYEIGDKEAEKTSKQKKEIRVQQLATSILRQSISQAVEERADVTKEQKEVNTAVGELRDLVEGWCAKAIPELQALENIDENDMSSLEARTKIGTLYAEMKQFQTQLHLMKGRIQNNAWKAEGNKNAVIKRIEEVEKASNGLVQMIKNAERRQFLLGKHATVALKLQQLREQSSSNDNLRAVAATLCDPQLMKDVRLLLGQGDTESLDNLSQQFDNFAKNILSLDKIQAQRVFLHELSKGDSSLIDQLLNAKRTNRLTMSDVLKNIENRVLLTLPIEKHKVFLDILSAVAMTNLQADEVRQKEQIIRLCQQTLSEADAAYAESEERIRSLQLSIIETIDNTNLLDPNYVATQNAEIDMDLEGEAHNVEDFQKKCREVLTDVPFVNVNLVNPNMLKKHGKKIVFDTTQRYVDELLQFFTRQEILPSAVRHLAIMPYNRHEKEKRVGHPVGYDDHAPAYQPVT